MLICKLFDWNNFYSKFVEIQNTTLVFFFTILDLGVHSITIELVDIEGLTNDYLLNVSAIDSFEFKPKNISNVMVFYPEVTRVNISSFLIQSANHSYNIYIQENNTNIGWIKFEEVSQSIVIFNYNQNHFGMHLLTISIYDNWFLKYFNSSVEIEISPSHPPSATGGIIDITAYQGQKIVKLMIYQGLFYARNNKYLITIKWCTEVDMISKDLKESYINYNSETLLQIIFPKNYVGHWNSSVIAVDFFMQTSMINFSIEVLKWLQEHWLYWDGPETIDWTEWIPGFLIDPSTGEWRVDVSYFDSWVIISFVIIILLLTILTDRDVNASYVLLESITLYWMLFLVFEEKEWKIKHYFVQIKIVLTHFNSFLFPIFSKIFKLDKNSNLIEIYYF